MLRLRLVLSRKTKPAMGNYPENEYVTFVKLIWTILVLFIALWGLGLSIYGIVLAFSASVILGIASLIVEPAPLIFGIAKFFFGVNLPVLLLEWLKSHGG
jgi:hypothetical protein